MFDNEEMSVHRMKYSFFFFFFVIYGPIPSCIQLIHLTLYLIF